MTQQEQKEALRAAESKTFSQFGEDGILKLLFDKLGPRDRRFVEFGVQNGKECNTARLSIQDGWCGLLMEGNPVDVQKARAYYASLPQIRPRQVRIEQAFVTAENINALLEQFGFTGPIDLLSIDIDGNDLWVWQAIHVLRPRVVVIEYNAAFGEDKSISVEYDPAFERFAKHPSGLYHGASLSACANLGRRMGYTLVGCESMGVNAFFVEREEAAASGFVELSPEVAYYEHAWRKAKYPSTAAQWEIIKGLAYSVVE